MRDAESASTGNGQNHFGIQAGATAQGYEYQCVKQIENTPLSSLNKSTGDGQNQKRSGEPPKFWQLPDLFALAGCSYMGFSLPSAL